MEHDLSPGCWCEPRQDEEEPSLWIHNEVVMNKETPRTDAAYWAAYPNGGETAAWDFARKIELELAEAHEEIYRLRKTLETIGTYAPTQIYPPPG